MKAVYKTDFNVVKAYNDVDIGDIYQEVDGYYVFQFYRCDGSFDAPILRGIADLLDEINKPWNDIINNDPSINDTSNARISDSTS